MKYFALLYGLAIGMVATSANANTNACAKIDNDVARLACYDELFQSASNANGVRNPDDVFAELDGLVAYSSQEEIAALKFDNAFDQCLLTGTRLYKFLTFPVRNQPTVRTYAVAAFSVNLHDVDIRKSRDGAQFSQPGNVYLVTKRDKYLTMFAPGFEVHIKADGIENPYLESFDEAYQHFQSVAYTNHAHSWNALRETYFPLIVGSHLPDRKEIQDKLLEVADACQKQE